MMIKRYKLPIKGTVTKKEPLTGDDKDPVMILPLDELPSRPRRYVEELGIDMSYGFSGTCLEYNIDEGWCEVELEADEAIHTWLTNLLPELESIKASKGYKLKVNKDA